MNNEVNVPEGVQVFRYEGGDLNYQPWDSAPAEWDGNLGDLIGDYISVESIGLIRERLEAECNEEAADFSTELEDIASALASGGPRPDYDALGEDLNRIACELAALQPTSIEAIRSQERQRVREALGENVHRVVEALETWLLDYADPDDGDWPERAEYVKAINDFRSALNTKQATISEECAREQGWCGGSGQIVTTEDLGYAKKETTKPCPGCLDSDCQPEKGGEG